MTKDTKPTSYTVTENDGITAVNGIMTLADLNNLLEWEDTSKFIKVDMKMGDYDKVATVDGGYTGRTRTPRTTEATDTSLLRAIENYDAGWRRAKNDSN